jgi:hypothetical protein
MTLEELGPADGLSSGHGPQERLAVSAENKRSAHLDAAKVCQGLEDLPGRPGQGRDFLMASGHLDFLRVFPVTQNSGSRGNLLLVLVLE